MGVRRAHCRLTSAYAYRETTKKCTQNCSEPMSALGSDQLHDWLMLIIPSFLTPLSQLGGELGSILQHRGQGPENNLQIPDSRFQGLSGPMSSEASCCQDMPLLPRLRITSWGLSHLQLFLRAKHLGKFCIFASTGFRLLFHSQQSHVDLTHSVSISPNTDTILEGPLKHSDIGRSV